MKNGWHWAQSELDLLERYIEARNSGDAVGWGSGRSEIQAIADQIGRPYFSVYRRMQRLAQQRPARPEPMRNYLPHVRMTAAGIRRIEKAVQGEGLSCMADFIRRAIDNELEKCSDADSKARG
jgi:hypothetical protein